MRTIGSTVRNAWPMLSCAAALSAQAPASPLKGARLELDSLTATPDYYIYAYRIVNAPESRGGISSFSLDLTAPNGTGFAILPATGLFMNGAAMRGAVHVHDHVPLGTISPTNWEAFLKGTGQLDWYGAQGGMPGEHDSIGPGDSLGTFGLRSPFLPGVRALMVAPTFASCCTQPRPSTVSSPEPELPNTREFQIKLWTVAPTYPPSQMTAELLTDLLGRVCGPLKWISPGPTCEHLRSALPPAQSHGQGDHMALRTFLDALDEAHGPGKSVSDNAYWMLRIDANVLLNRP